eukprot:scaffold38322_cov191-Amphora_coffeaeformis.AAC.4
MHTSLIALKNNEWGVCTVPYRMFLYSWSTSLVSQVHPTERVNKRRNVMQRMDLKPHERRRYSSWINISSSTSLGRPVRRILYSMTAHRVIRVSFTLAPSLPPQLARPLA